MIRFNSQFKANQSNTGDKLIHKITQLINKSNKNFLKKIGVQSQINKPLILGNNPIKETQMINGIKRKD